MEEKDHVEVGQVAPEVFQTFTELRQHTDAVYREVGRLEMLKHQHLSDLRQMEISVRKVLEGEADRVGIRRGAEWQLTPEGKMLASPGDLIKPPGET